MRYGVFMPKMIPNGHRFESPSVQNNIFPIKYTRNVKSMQNAVKSTVICHRKIDYDDLNWFYVSKTWILRYRSLSVESWNFAWLRIDLHTQFWKFFEFAKEFSWKILEFSSKMVKNSSKSVWVQARELKFCINMIC
jgi:hypothetical protein